VGDLVEARLMAPPTTAAQPEPNVRLDILHVDDAVVVVNKPAGLVVHPSLGHEGGTLVNGLLALGFFRADDFSSAGEAGDSVRPGIVHRLDKGTSGVLVVARTPAARELLKVQFQSHSMERLYDAIVVGVAPSGTFATLHGRHPRDRHRFTTRVRTGRRAVTHVRAVGRLRGATQIECTLETGRTHQIRVHMQSLGFPLVGDALYGKQHLAAFFPRQALHAYRLGLIHPNSGKELEWETAIPEDFAALLTQANVAVPPL